MQISVRDIPETETIFSYLRQQTGYESACRRCAPRMGKPSKIEMDLVDIDIAELTECVVGIFQKIGFFGWQHAEGNSQNYGGFSLTYNPDHQDGLDPNVSSIGTPKNDRSQFFWRSIETHKQVKHSYFDTYGFRKRTPASQHGLLGQLIDSFSCPLVRSRVGIIPGENIDPSNENYREKQGWHRDEPVFENLRVNIPLQTDESYVFQMEGEEPYHLEVGKAYTWDTNRPHRVFAVAPTKTVRIHLVLGFSPWFSYDKDLDTWFPNEHFGKVHPFDMLAEGLMSRHLRVRPRLN